MAQLVRTGVAVDAVVVRADNCGAGVHVDRDGGLHGDQGEAELGKGPALMGSCE
jgi:xanthine dehydrogenase molybdopterin-binding subunit B